jgi:hypothetical protein
MKRCLFVVILCFVANANAQEPANSAATQELLKLEKTRVDALVKGDIPVLDKLLAADLSYVHSSGALESKAKFLGDLGSGERKYVSMQPDNEPTVRSYGDWAILNGAVTTTVIYRGQTSDLHIRFTEVWAKHGTQWQVVAWHSTKIPQQ